MKKKFGFKRFTVRVLSCTTIYYYTIKVWFYKVYR
jgi:hypothetical protein